MEKLQLPSVARFPPVKVMLEEPEILEPEPQTSASGRPVATRSVSALSKSSVKVISVAAKFRSKLVTVISSVPRVEPGTTVIGEKLRLRNSR